MMEDSPKAAAAAAMLPDSTQSGNTVSKRKNGKRRKKKDGTSRKKKSKEGAAKGENAETNADTSALDDLDLSKPLFAIGHYISDREDMLQQAFQSVNKEQIDAMMPDVLKDCSMEVVKALCLGQLEGMSKKRIFHVLSGEEMLSSSDTDESGNEDNPAQDRSQADTAEEHEEGPEPQTDGFEPQIEGYDPQTVGYDPQNDGYDPQADGYNRLAKGSGDPPGVEQPQEALPQEGMEYEPHVEGDAEVYGQHTSTTVTPELRASPEYVLDSDEEVDLVQGETPAPVRKMRKRKEKKPRLINPSELEEGEVSMESSEYTDASDNDGNVEDAALEGAVAETIGTAAGVKPAGGGTGEAGVGSTQGQEGKNEANAQTVSGTEARQTVTASEKNVGIAAGKRHSVETVVEIKHLNIPDVAKKSGLSDVGGSQTQIEPSSSSGVNDGVSDVNRTRERVVCNVSSLSETSDGNSEGGAKTNSTSGRTCEKIVVCNVSSSAVEESRTEGGETDKTIQSKFDCVAEQVVLRADQSTNDNVSPGNDLAASNEAVENAVTLPRDGDDVSASQEGASCNVVTAACDQGSVNSADVRGDSLSVNNDSEFDEEASESMSQDDTPVNQSSVRVGDREGDNRSSPLSNSVEQSVESNTSSGEERGSSSDKGSASDSEDLGQSTPDNQGNSAASANVEPKLNILELELRARAIRSLMNHCAAVEKLT